MKSSWFVSVEPEEIVDPFDSIFLKLLTVIVYIIEILSSIILLTLVAYETKGYAGHYRTVMNQLLSCGYGAVSSRLFFRVISKVVYTLTWSTGTTGQLTHQRGKESFTQYAKLVHKLL